jgi:HD-like signal output (HDOD) protein
MSDLSALFKTIKLPVMSEVAHALIRTLHDEEVSIAEVRDIIAKDPTLSAKLLRAANSARMGLRREVNSLDSAIAMIGMSQMRTLALSACMNVSFPMVAGLNRAEFWHNSMACAGYAQWLAGGIGQDGQLAWLTGMMARLGELIIGQANPDSLQAIEKMPHAPGERWQRELKLLGYTETEVTAELARRWHFPADIVRALDAVAKPMQAQPFSALGGVVHLAGWLADMASVDAQVLDQLPADVVKALELNRDWMLNRMPQPDSFFDISAL